MVIVRAAIDAADAGRLVRQSLAAPHVDAMLREAAAVRVVAAGKAAAVMAAAFGAASPVPAKEALTIGVHDAGHPIPDARSVAAARRALDVARRAAERDVMVLLLSGGASALMSAPAEGLSLEDKQQTVRLLLGAGADITELNTVRKHLSAIKGGRLAAACAGRTLTLAVSDVVGDDLSVIGSGPTVADPSTWQMALDVIDRRGGRGAFPRAAVTALERGLRGEVPETPKVDDRRLAGSRAFVIGGRTNALEGAREAAEALGYHVHVVSDPVVGAAREAALNHAAALARLMSSRGRPLCVLSAGETTVHVKGRGKGGRNQEFALALARPLGDINVDVAAASVGTDGIDGPTDAAGALVDRNTFARALAAGMRPDTYLNENNSYEFFDALDDLIRTGPTDTNVGDLQVVLIKE